MKKISVGQRLKQARLQRGYSQQDVASRTKMTKNAISNIEREITRSPSSENLLPLAKALDVDPNWLITGKGDPKPAVSTPPLHQTIEPQAAYGFQPQINEFQSFASTIFGDAAQLPMMQDIMNQAIALWLNQSPANQDTFAAYLAASAAHSMGKPKAELLPMMRTVVKQTMEKFNAESKTYTEQEIESIKEKARQKAIEDYRQGLMDDAHAERHR